MIDKLLLPLLQELTNRYIQLDPDSKDKLQAIQGKQIKVELTDWKLEFLIMVKDDQLNFSKVDNNFNSSSQSTGFSTQNTSVASQSTQKNNDSQENIQNPSSPHVILTGSSFAFFNLSQSEAQQPLFTGEVIFHGEISTAQKFQQFWQALEIDWEDHLSKYTGDIIARQTSLAFKAGFQWLNQLKDTFLLNTPEYLQEEKRLLPTDIELENFYHQVDEITSRVERLAAQTDLLLKDIAKQNQTKNSKK